jgi:hypothetical protein
MKRVVQLILVTALLVLTGTANHGKPAPPAGEEKVTFVPVHVNIDPEGKPLACYQVTVTASKNATLVGVEGGDSDAFNKAPYYDPRALQSSRIIIGAYSVGGDLPAEKTRVATLMFRVTGPMYASYEAKLNVAGTSDASEISATVTLEPITWSQHASVGNRDEVAMGGAR